MKLIQLKENINSDKIRYGYKSSFKCFLFVAGFRFTIYLRITKFLKTKNKLLYNVARLYLRQMSYKFGIDMYDSTVLGKGFYISHFGGIVINGGTQFGDNVNIIAYKLEGIR